MKKSSLVSLLIILSAVLVSSCKKDKKEEVSQKSDNSGITFSTCKSGSKSLDSNQSCIQITAINNNKLAVKHFNTEFCCGTSLMQIDCNIFGGKIIIKEVDLGPFTDCYCLHDMSYVIGPLQNMHYQILVIESENSYERDTIFGEFDYMPGLFKVFCN